MLAPIYLRPTFHSYATDEQREFVECNVDNLRAISPDCLNICVSIPLSHNIRKMVFEFVYSDKTIIKSFTSVQSQINKMKKATITSTQQSVPAQQQLPGDVNIKLQQTFIDNATAPEAFEVGSNSNMIRAFATQVGADRVYVTKTLTNGSRPLTFRFYDRSRFVTNRTLNYITKKVGK